MVKRVIVSLLIAFAVTTTVIANNRSWQETKPTEPTAIERTDSEQIEVYTRDGYIYITTTRPVTVKIFSILGQLISSEKIAAGTHRCRIDSRGIYILKAGPITRRITI